MGMLLWLGEIKQGATKLWLVEVRTWGFSALGIECGRIRGDGKGGFGTSDPASCLRLSTLDVLRNSMSRNHLCTTIIISLYFPRGCFQR